MLTTEHIAPDLLEPKDWPCEPLWRHRVTSPSVNQRTVQKLPKYPATAPFSPPDFFCLIILFILIGGQLLYNIVVFFAIHQHESATGVHVSPILNSPPPPSPSPPSGLYQSTVLGCPASCIKLALVIYFTYGNIHVSMPTCLLKMLCWNLLGSSVLFRHEPLVSLQDPAVNLSRFQTPRFQFVWPHCVSGAWTCVSISFPNFSRI